MRSAGGDSSAVPSPPPTSDPVRLESPAHGRRACPLARCSRWHCSNARCCNAAAMRNSICLERINSANYPTARSAIDRLTRLVTRLQRFGYRRQTIGDRIVLELDAHSRLRGSIDQIEQMLPLLEKQATSGARPVRSKKGKKKGRKKKRRAGKIVVTSAKIPARSAETQRGISWRKSRSEGGLPGLGKR